MSKYSSYASIKNSYNQSLLANTVLQKPQTILKEPFAQEAMIEYTVYNPDIKYVYSLQSVLQNDKVTISRISEAIKKRGFTFIRLPPKMVSLIDNIQKTMEIFFSKNKYYKKNFYKDPIFGYFDVSHKESFRLLTGNRITEQQLPLDFNNVVSFIRMMDRLMKRITLLCAPYLFPNIMNEAKIYNIPLFDDNNQWGMFDIANYYNDGKRKDINCEEHADPGLLSMHLRSTEQGLQLKDENGKWFSPYNNKNIAILWTGTVATKINPEIKPGIHRVINPTSPNSNLNQLNKKPRMAIWYEICTSQQEHTELINKSEYEKKGKETKTGIPESKIRGTSLLDY